MTPTTGGKEAFDASPSPGTDAGQVVELRQYSLRPGRRDALIELFDKEFIETQEAVGAVVLGQFRDLDNPDRFIWLRAFPDMQARRCALAAFYGGPVWSAHRAAANATMVDSDDVLLLQPAGRGSGFATSGLTRPPAGTGDSPATLRTATVYSLPRPAAEGFADFFADRVTPVLAQACCAPDASFVTEDATNTFPALPVREGEHVFVWFASFRSADDHRDRLRQLERLAGWRRLQPDLTAQLSGPARELRLAPTRRSLLR